MIVVFSVLGSEIPQITTANKTSFVQLRTSVQAGSWNAPSNGKLWQSHHGQHTISVEFERKY